MNSTGDKIIDALLSSFREQVRPLIMRGSPVNLDENLEYAIFATKRRFRADGVKEMSEKVIRMHIRTNKDQVLNLCRKIIFEIEKRERLLDIRKTGVGSLLDDFARRSQYNVQYKLRGNSTVGITVRIPSTGQRLIFNSSFKKVMSDGWLDALQKDLDEFMGLVDKFGRIRVTNG